MKIRVALCGAALAAIASFSTAQATTLSGSLTADNQFTAYLSTDNNTLGNQIASGNDWTNPSSFSTGLVAGTTYFLHIVASNFPPPGSSNPDAFLGNFSLSDSLFHFVNGTQSLLTNTTDWTADAHAAADSWVAPTSTPLSFGANNDPSTIWNQNHGTLSGIDPSALWIWSNPDNGDTAFLSTAIVAATPIPAALPLFASALMGLGFLARRKRRVESA